MADEPTPETGDDTEPETGDEETPETDEAPKPGRRSAAAALRKANAEAAKYRTEAAALKKQLDDSQSKTKSEMDKLIGRFDAMEERAKTAERKALVAEIAEEYGLSNAQARRLSGDTREELAGDAEELIETFGVKVKAKPKADTEEASEPDAKPDGNGAKPPAGKPKEKLRGGATPTGTDEAVDPVKLAKSILDSPF